VRAGGIMYLRNTYTYRFRHNIYKVSSYLRSIRPEGSDNDSLKRLLINYPFKGVDPNYIVLFFKNVSLCMFFYACKNTLSRVRQALVFVRRAVKKCPVDTLLSQRPLFRIDVNGNPVHPSITFVPVSISVQFPFLPYLDNIPCFQFLIGSSHCTL